MGGTTSGGTAVPTRRAPTPNEESRALPMLSREAPAFHPTMKMAKVVNEYTPPFISSSGGV